MLELLKLKSLRKIKLEAGMDVYSGMTERIRQVRFFKANIGQELHESHKNK